MILHYYCQTMIILCTMSNFLNSQYTMSYSMKPKSDTCSFLHIVFRAHSNGSIRRSLKTDASEVVTMRSGLGVNLKDVTVFNRGREKGLF